MPEHSRPREKLRENGVAVAALSLRQPNSEQVLRGKKKIEYRNMPTSKRERVYIYAANTPADQDAWDEIGLEPGELPTGVLVGTVEIVGCRKTKIEYEWDLARPVRLKRLIKPKNHPQPGTVNSKQQTANSRRKKANLVLGAWFPGWRWAFGIKD